MEGLICPKNCFFESIMFELGPLASTYTAAEFRAEMVEYIKFDLKSYVSPIWHSCSLLYPPEIIKNYNFDGIISRYLCDLQKDGFTCGPESLYAVCNLKQIKINVIYYGTNKTASFIPRSGVFNAEVNLIYCISHYFSLKKFNSSHNPK